MSGAPPPPNAAELAALHEEKQRLLRRLQAKQAQAGSASTSTGGAGSGGSSSSLASREAGFNTYISGANEARVMEQRRREKAAAAAARRDATGGAHRTWAKPPAASSTTSSNAAPAGAASAASGHVAAPRPSPTGSASGSAVSKPKRKQWTQAPVAVLGAEGVVAPPPPPPAREHHHHHQQHQGQRGGLLHQFQQHDDDEDEEVEEEEHHPDAGYDDDEDFDVEADDDNEHQLPLPPMGAGVQRGDSNDGASSVSEALEEFEDAAAGGGSNLPPLSPPPLALRKKDVSLLRESLEILEDPSASSSAALPLLGMNAPPSALVGTRSVAPLAPAPEPTTVVETVYRVVEPPSGSPSSFGQGIDDELREYDGGDDTHEAGLMQEHEVPLGMHRPTSSSSPTLPSRSLSAAGVRALASPVARVSAGGAPSGVSASMVQRAPDTAGPRPGEVVNVRTSVSFAGGERASMDGSTNLRSSIPGQGQKGMRPSTPQQTDSSTLRTSLLLSQSFDKDAVDVLLSRLRNLSKPKRAMLLRVLGDLEQGDASDIPPELQESLQTLQGAKHVREARERAEKHRQEKEAREAEKAATAAAEAAEAAGATSPNHADKLALLKQKQQQRPGGSPLSARQQGQQQLQPPAKADPTAASSPRKPAASVAGASDESAGASAAGAAAAAPGDEIVVASFAPPKPSVTLRILGTHGHAHLLGLGAIELFDPSGARLRVPPSSVHMSWTPGHPNAAALGQPRGDVAKVFAVKTAAASRMGMGMGAGGMGAGMGNEDLSTWSMPYEPETLFVSASPTASSADSSFAHPSRHGFDLSLFLPSFLVPSLLVISNFARAGILPGNEGAKGVREIEVFVQGDRVFKGRVDKEGRVQVPLSEEASKKMQLQQQQQAVPETKATSVGAAVPAAAAPAPAATTAAVNAASARPAWLQGATVPAAAAVPSAVEVPAVAATQQPLPGLGHSASTSALNPRRRTNSMLAGLGAAGSSSSAVPATSRDGVPQTAGDATSASGGMVPPLLPAQAPAAWGEAEVPAVAQKRPMSGRRAGPLLPGAGTAAATSNVNVGGSALPPSGVSNIGAGLAGATVGGAQRVPSAGRRRPPLLAGQASSSGSLSNPSSRGPSPGPEGKLDSDANVPAAAAETMQHQQAQQQPRVRRSELEESWDSLEHFKHNHYGRLPPAAPEGSAVAPVAAANKPAATMMKALQIPSSAATGADEELLASERKKASRSNSMADDLAPVLSDTAVPAAAVVAEEKTTTATGAVGGMIVPVFPFPPSSSPFPIPTLPRGRRLTLHLHSTYGDAYYIGLAGLDLFDGAGRLMQFGSTHAARAARISASPADLNVLPGYHSDPRVAANLLDGVNASTDDMHAWLAPFSAGKHHVVVIELAPPGAPLVALSMLRVWNFNKSRIHAARGVRHMSMTLDGICIFQGEVSKAPGNVAEAASCCENILFTTEPRLLARIAAHSGKQSAAGALAPVSAQGQDEFEPSVPAVPPARPSTGGTSTGADNDCGGSRSAQDKLLSGLNVHTSVDMSVMRPKTSAVPHLAPQPKEPEPVSLPQAKDKPKSSRPSSSRYSLPCVELTLTLLSTWGDSYFVGLTGLELLDPALRVIPLSPECLAAFPRDINTVPGHSGDNRTLDKLVDGENVTMNDNHMWLAPVLQPDEASGGGGGGGGKGGKKMNTQWLRIRLPCPGGVVPRVSALRIWNYNKGEEDTYRGMRSVSLTAVTATSASAPTQSVTLSPPGGFILRKAPGTADFDFGQTIFLRDPSVAAAVSTASIDILRRAPIPDASLPVLPTGFVLKFLLLSTQGDAHYVGLNGLELFDHTGTKVRVGASNVAAVPASLNDLSPPPNPPDTRTVGKLFDGVNDTWDDRHMWLAPLLPSASAAAVAATAAGSAAHCQARNVLYISFDAPVALSAVKLWNYSKTPSRGVHALQILLDDQLVWDGALKAAPAPAQAKGASQATFAQTIVFCALPALMAQEAGTIMRDSGEQQEVMLVDERRVVTGASSATSTAGKSAINRPQTMARGQ